MVVPWSVVVEPVVPPMVTVVVLPAAPPVAMATAFVEPETVAPVARFSVEAAVVAPIVVVEAPSTGPMVVRVVEPTTPPVATFTAFVEPETVAPVLRLVVPVAVELPKLLSAAEKVVGPAKV